MAPPFNPLKSVQFYGSTTVDYRQALHDLGISGHTVPHSSSGGHPSSGDNAPPSCDLGSPFRALSSPSRSTTASSFLAYTRDRLLHPSGALARDYLRLERGLDENACEVFQLGLNPTDLQDDPARWGLQGEKRLFLPRGLVIPRFYHGRLLALKIRRPLPGESLARVFEPGPPPAKISKFLSVRGSLSGLFGCDTWLGYPALLLAEGEWDSMLAWTLAGDLCDVGTLGSASQGLSPEEELELYAYRRILVVYDADLAGETGSRRLQPLKRGLFLSPPAHDLCDFWRQGGDLRGWLQSHLAAALPQPDTPPSPPDPISTHCPNQEALALPDPTPTHGLIEEAPISSPR